MYLAKRRNETALKRCDGIDIHQRIPVNGKELDKYRGVDGLNRAAKTGKSFIDSRGHVRKASDEKLRDTTEGKKQIRSNDQKTEQIGTSLENIRYKQSVTRLPNSNKDAGKELGIHGTVSDDMNQEKSTKGLERQEDKRLPEKNADQDLKETKVESAPGKTVIRSSGNAKDLRNDVLTKRKSARHTEPHVQKMIGKKNADRRTDGRK